jgi:hypothetical protein
MEGAKRQGEELQIARQGIESLGRPKAAQDSRGKRNQSSHFSGAKVTWMSPSALRVRPSIPG